VSKVDVALGYMNKDIVCHIKLCVLFCYVICGDLISKVDNSQFSLTHDMKIESTMCLCGDRIVIVHGLCM